MQQYNSRSLIPWLVRASDIQRYLGRACNQCLRGRVVFFFHVASLESKWSRPRLLCLTPVAEPEIALTALAEFERGRYHCVDLSTLRRRPLGRLTLTVLKWRGDRSKPAIEEASGPSMTTSAAAKRLRCSMERVRSRIMRGTIAGYPALGSPRRWRIPLWQFDSGKKIHAWVPELIHAYGSNGWGLIHFVCVPRISLEGGRYLHLLQTGRADDVLTAAKRSNPD